MSSTDLVMNQNTSGLGTKKTHVIRSSSSERNGNSTVQALVRSFMHDDFVTAIHVYIRMYMYSISSNRRLPQIANKHPASTRRWVGPVPAWGCGT